MPSLKEIRNRINSVSSTMQITSAMKMVSAAKLKRAQDAVTKMRPYAEKLQDILINLSATLDLSENSYSEQREKKNILIVGITSNRGLCGVFNNNIIKRVTKISNSREEKGGSVKVLCLGKKIKDIYKKNDSYYINDSLQPLEDIFSDLSFENVEKISENLMTLFTSEEFDEIILVYNRFVNAATQAIEQEQFLPILPPEETDNLNNEYLFEPSKEEIVEELIPKSLKIQLFKGLLDSFAAEHGARMTAMHKATDNAQDLQKELKLSYNKARQATITNEILEIVGGAEALNA